MRYFLEKYCDSFNYPSKEKLDSYLQEAGYEKFLKDIIKDRRGTGKTTLLVLEMVDYLLDNPRAKVCFAGLPPERGEEYVCAIIKQWCPENVELIERITFMYKPKFNPDVKLFIDK